ncbi:hypothetical protein GMMP15_390061 [Candidatus Magnetomoraceae bacterium gMMP-15]
MILLNKINHFIKKTYLDYVGQVIIFENQLPDIELDQSVLFFYTQKELSVSFLFPCSQAHLENTIANAGLFL